MSVYVCECAALFGRQPLLRTKDINWQLELNEAGEEINRARQQKQIKSSTELMRRVAATNHPVLQ